VTKATFFSISSSIVNFFFFQWVRTEEKITRVVQVFKEEPHSSIRRIAQREGMPSVGTIHSILKEAKFHPFIMQIHHCLRKTDLQQRVVHAEAQLTQIERDPEYVDHLLFSDEAHFSIHGSVNTHNFRYWSQANPCWFHEQPLHSPRITVWAGIGCHGVVGPFFFEENVNGTNYLEMLTLKLLPTIQQWPIFNSLIFMQDGAPPHWSTGVRNFLSAKFPNRWMGRSSPNFPWPPYSPDLTPCDFFLWGWIKSQVYTTPVADITQLRERIEQTFAALPLEMVCRAVKAYEHRLIHCLMVGGRSTEESK
jgi:transposase